ncbi:MAG: InlB B-repeat-containing protein [Leptospirales bacterium]|nr:InlB B-repeat-containing protein [Leptospirales bacterium]
MKTKITLLAILLAFIMTACYNSNEKNATLTLYLGGSSSSYSASSLTNWPPTDAERSSLIYDVKLSKSSEEIAATFSGSDLITFNVTSGDWIIEVTAYSDNELYAHGVTGVTLRPGQNRVSILMQRAGIYEFSIKILQSEIYLQQGGDHTFTVEPSFGLKNRDDFAKSPNPYKWTVLGKNSSNTYIDSSGYLKVGLDEPPNTILKVTVECITNNSTKPGTAIVTVSDSNNALPPSIETHPQDKIYSVGETETLTVEAILLSGNGILSYQWYSSTTNSNSGGTPLPGETNASYTLPIGTTGMLGITTYYYVEVTNTDSTAIGYKTAMTPSNVAAVKVTSQHIVTFNGNGASGTAPTTQFVDNGSTITLPNQGSLLKTGHIFAGWNTKIDGTGTDYDAGSSYTPTGSVTLYAKWNSTPIFTITFADIIDQAPSITGPTISLSGTGGYSTAENISVDNPFDYTEFNWYIDESRSAASRSFFIDLDATNNTYNGVGLHYLTLELTKDGIQYNKTITFEVID